MPTRHIQTPLLHRAVVHGDTIYLAGMVADDKTLPAGSQTRQILEKLDALLKTLNSDATRLLSATIYLAEMRHKEEMNTAWTTYFEPRNLPARATIGVASLGPQVLVEVVAVAAARGSHA